MRVTIAGVERTPTYVVITLKGVEDRKGSRVCAGAQTMESGALGAGTGRPDTAAQRATATCSA